MTSPKLAGFVDVLRRCQTRRPDETLRLAASRANPSTKHSKHSACVEEVGLAYSSRGQAAVVTKLTDGPTDLSDVHVQPAARASRATWGNDCRWPSTLDELLGGQPSLLPALPPWPPALSSDTKRDRLPPNNLITRPSSYG